MALKEGARDQALRFMRAAADGEDGSVKHVAMENGLYPLRELYAELLLEVGESAPALSEFETALKQTPNRYRALLGVARAADAAGNHPKASEYYGKLVELTKNADTARPETRRRRNSWRRDDNAAAQQRTLAGACHHAPADVVDGATMTRWIIIAALLGALVAAGGLSVALEFPWRSSFATWIGAPDPKTEAKLPLEDWPICTSMAAMGSEADWAQLDPDFANGKRALAAEDWSGTITAFKLAALRDPRNADIQNYIGYAHRSCANWVLRCSITSRLSCSIAATAVPLSTLVNSI